jgi:hypothetical protein
MKSMPSSISILIVAVAAAATAFAGGARAETLSPTSIEPHLALQIAQKPPEAEAEGPVPSSAALAGAISAYRTHPDATTWQPVFKELRALITSPRAMHAPSGTVLHANPGLTDIGAVCNDAGSGARVWAFPKISDSQSLLLQYQCPTGPATHKTVGKGKHRKVIVEPAPVVTKFQVLPIPSNVSFRDAQFVRSTPRAIKSEIRDLVLVGNERVGGTIWIATYRLSESGLAEDAVALSTVPPYLVQGCAGTPGFSGNDLVFSLSGGGGPQTSGYKMVLKFVDGKFGMEGQTGEQGPSMVVFQFMQALQQNRLDVARAWLSDPKLISLPRYAGLLNRGSDKPIKVIAMSAPLLQGSRFRLMTYEKTDLIMDVGKVKNQWTIKALYFAPPDPLAQKLGGMSAPQAPSSLETEPKPAAVNAK